MNGFNHNGLFHLSELLTTVVAVRDMVRCVQSSRCHRLQAVVCYNPKNAEYGGADQEGVRREMGGKNSRSHYTYRVLLYTCSPTRERPFGMIDVAYPTSRNEKLRTDQQ